MSKKITLRLFCLIIIAFVFSLIINKTSTFKSDVIGKVFEKTTLFLHFSPEGKAEYWRDLVGRRLSEMKLVAEEEKLGIFEETSSRYATYVGMYSNYIIAEKLTDQKEITLQMFAKHAEVLEPFLYKYESNSAWWLLLQQDIDTLAIFREKIDKGL